MTNDFAKAINDINDDWIDDDLRNSGLNRDTFKIEPLTDESQLRKRLGFDKIGSTKIIEIGGYWIPYPNVSGYYRLKLRGIIDDA